MTEKYTSSLTSEAFLFSELKIFLDIMKDKNANEAKKTIIVENFYFLKTENAIKKIVSIVNKRINALNSEIIEIFYNETHDVQKIINLFSIYKTNKLFHDFIDEVLIPKYTIEELNFNELTIERYLDEKKEYFPEVKKWSNKTFKNLKSQIKSILIESNLLENNQLKKIILNTEFKNILKENKEILFLKGIGEDLL
ncbi:MAG TPA: DUF1819 family protein [Tepiditoga sp.]|nr:DUF1819 family protein [Tepiditoga sp.]